MSAANVVGKALAAAARALTFPFGVRRGAKALAQLNESAAPEIAVATPLGRLTFRCPTAETTRVPTRLLSWEPETIAWIDRHISPDDCLWDIGAHIGAFALYGGLKVRSGKGEVLAFEPSAQNYAALSQNIVLSGLSGSVRGYCVALSDKTEVGLFHMANAAAGNSGHAFGKAENVHGAFAPAASQATIGFTIDDFVGQFRVRRPDHIKLDVDSIEEQVLRGAVKTLPHVKSILIEVELERTQAWKAAIRALLSSAGLDEAQSDSDAVARNKVFVNSKRAP